MILLLLLALFAFVAVFAAMATGALILFALSVFVLALVFAGAVRLLLAGAVFVARHFNPGGRI